MIPWVLVFLLGVLVLAVVSMVVVLATHTYSSLPSPTVTPLPSPVPSATPSAIPTISHFVVPQTALSHTYAYLLGPPSGFTAEELANFEALVSHGLQKFLVNYTWLTGNPAAPTTEPILNSLVNQYPLMQFVISLVVPLTTMANNQLTQPSTRLSDADKLTLTQIVQTQVLANPSRVCAYYIADEPSAQAVPGTTLWTTLQAHTTIYAAVQSGTVVTPISATANVCLPRADIWSPSALCPCESLSLFRVIPAPRGTTVQIFNPDVNGYLAVSGGGGAQPPLVYSSVSDPNTVWTSAYDEGTKSVVLSMPLVTTQTLTLVRYLFSHDFLQDVYTTIRTLDPVLDDRPVIMADTAYFFGLGRSLQCVPEIPTGNCDILLFDQYVLASQQNAYMDIWGQAQLWAASSRPWGFVYLATNSAVFTQEQQVALYQYLQNFTLAGYPNASQRTTPLSGIYLTQSAAQAAFMPDSPATLTGPNYTTLLSFVQYLQQQVVV